MIGGQSDGALTAERRGTLCSEEYIQASVCPLLLFSFPTVVPWWCNSVHSFASVVVQPFASFVSGCVFCPFRCCSPSTSRSA